VGYVGLLKALENYEPTHNAKFSTYATHCVYGELRHYIRDRVEVIRRPRWLRGLSREVAGCIETFLHKQHRLPSVAEIAASINVAEEGVVEILRAQAPVSLEEMQGNGMAGVSVEKIRSSQYQTFRLPLEDKIAIEQAMGRLLELEKRIIYLFFYRDFTQSQIAGVVGLSPKKVSRVLHRGLDRLRQILRLET
jgi:RNA polymerase sigma-B factor